MQESAFICWNEGSPPEVSKCDETSLLLKNVSNWTYITKEEKSMLGHIPMKDRITILICANASGNCKIKPMVIYHSENSRISKRNKE